MGFAYSNNGMAWRSWNDPNNLAPGEIYSDTALDATQLEAAFPGYDLALAARTALIAFNAAVNAGVQIVSTGTPAISGTYGILPQDEINITGLQAGVSSVPPAPWLGYYRDTAHMRHTMTAPQFTTLATAILGYIEALDEAYIAAAGGAPWAPPTQPVTIA